MKKNHGAEYIKKEIRKEVENRVTHILEELEGDGLKIKFSPILEEDIQVELQHTEIWLTATLIGGESGKFCFVITSEDLAKDKSLSSLRAAIANKILTEFN